ncbi:ABC transporter substrate-binding protein [Acinetobacter sp. 194]|uniref:extracellular solute-binding protein n=1 Tax=Acinetobacter shaoyimingii TaxID=2715164 RepID=UPI00140E3E51|nr:extracellular solute-binding protein [Acinetobacter shaoyimingii]NHB57820.1 ABC transporter substrate-binding protein [Acinetobacter shaoyimingii]
MPLNFACARTCVFLSACVVAFQTTWAQVQTTPYIAIHTQPKYAQAQSMPYANPHAPKGGMISAAKNGTFDNLNSMNGKGSSTEGVNYLFDTLMESSLDEPSVMYPLLAEKVTFDPVKTKYVIFHLNPKAKFSDGTPVTAEDVRYTFELYLTKSNPGLQMYLADIDQVNALSKYDVKITFKSDSNTEMPLILAQMPIYSKADWKNKDFAKLTMKPILGSGPYLIDRIDAGRSITYKRNPNYWAKDLAINRGRYNFDRIKYVYYRSLDIAFEGFKSGQYTFHEEYKSRNWVTEYDFNAVKSGMVVKYRHKTKVPVTTQSFVLNTRKAPFSDIYFRQALNYAYDFEWQNKALFYGQYQRLQSYFQNSELEAKGAPSATELATLKNDLPKLHPLQQQGVLANWKLPETDASGFNRKGLLQARSILLKAGYRYKNSQLLDQKGRVVRIELLNHQEGFQRTLMAYVRNLRKLGIQVTIRQVDTPQYIERMRRYDFEMTTMAMPQSLTPGNEQAQMWSSQAADEIGNYNFAGIKNPVIDDAVQQVIRAPSREQLILRTKILDRLLRSGYYQILTYGKSENWYAYWNMYKQPQVKPQLSLGLDYWWVDQNQAKKVAQYLRQN